MAKGEQNQGFRCSVCGEEHAGLPLDVAFEKPVDFFAVPPRQQPERCVVTQDWCVIDGARFYVRGCALVPVRDANEQFAWGVWAEVAPPDFDVYRETYNADASGVLPFPGKLCSEPRGYKGLDGYPVKVQLGPKGQRPAFILQPGDQLLFREQRDGITLHRVREILRTLFPDAGY